MNTLQFTPVPPVTDQSVPILEHTAAKSANPAEPAKRAAIMRAAERLFNNRRFHEVTLDEVAVAAQVGKGTIYRYFKDKDDLFFQVATSGFDDLCVRVAACASQPLSLRDRLLHIVEAVCLYFDERKEMFAIIHADASWIAGERVGLADRWRERRQRLPHIVAQVFAQAQREGELHPGLSPAVLAYHFLGMTRTVVRDLARELPAESHPALLVDLFLGGAAVRQEPC